MQKPRGYWTIERLRQVASRCSTRRGFRRRWPSAYAISHRRHLLDDLFRDHPNRGFSSRQVLNRTWCDKAACLAAARQCRTRSEFHQRHRGAYASCKLNGWFDDATAHMERVGNEFRRSVYAIVDRRRRIVYVGISKDPKQRFQDHLREGRSDVQLLIKSGAVLETLHNLVEKSEAARLEANVIEGFRARRWTVLNKMPAGGLGGNIVLWTLEACRREAAPCASRAEFKARCDGAFQAATRNGWMDEIFANHPDRGYSIEEPGSYTLERLRELALECRTRGEFAKRYASAYQTALQRALVDTLFHDHPNQGFAVRRRGTWTFDACLEAASQCSTRKDFHERYPGAYDAAYTNGWLEQIFAHHPNAGLLQRRRGSLTRSSAALLAKESGSLAAFRKRYPSVYAISLRRGWKLFADAPGMGRTRAAAGHWTLARSKSAARKYRSRAEIKREAWGAYETLRKARLLDRYFPRRACAATSSARERTRRS